jgi:hypothetical protein
MNRYKIFRSAMGFFVTKLPLLASNFTSIAAWDARA